jgi:addiction module HigA family antidote
VPEALDHAHTARIAGQKGTRFMAAEYLLDRKKITRPPTHPGVLFERDILPEFRRQRRTIGEIATLLGVSRQTLHRMMTGETAITPDIAARLGKLCGNGADLWLTLQARYDAWEATRRLAEQLKNIPKTLCDLPANLIHRAILRGSPHQQVMAGGL